MDVVELGCIPARHVKMRLPITTRSLTENYTEPHESMRTCLSQLEDTNLCTAEQENLPASTVS